MSANAFEVLGIAPTVGRLLVDSDDRADATRVVVVSHRLWQRQYAGAAGIVGTIARINGEPFVIVGVLPPHFPLPLRDIDIVTPLVPDADRLRHIRNSTNFLRLFGRLKPGIEAHQAQVELTGICRSLRDRFPVEYARKDAVRVDALHTVVVGNVRQTLFLLLTAVGVVLAAGLANLISLTLVRATARRSELTMRIALGASRVRLGRQLLMETLVLTGAGSVLGWLIAGVIVFAAGRWAPASVPRLTEVDLDVSVALLLIAVTIAVAILLALAPLAATASTRGGDLLRASGRGAIGNKWDRRIRNLLVVTEIAAALVLTLASGALARHLTQMQREHPGFNPDGVFQARVSIPSSYRSTDDVSRFYELVADRLAASPGVTQVGIISIAPLTGLLRTVPFSVEGQPGDARDRLMANLRTISPGYLAAVETRLLHGRTFAESDRSDTAPVALVSAALANRLFSGSAVNKRLLVNDNHKGPRPLEIVGVVDNVRHTALDLPAELDLYIPLQQVHADGVAAIRSDQFWMVRTSADPAAFRQTFVSHLRVVDPDAAVSDAGAMRQSIDTWLGPRRFTLALFGAFAAMAVFIAALGVYGLVSYGVSQRIAEIGLRMALGATPRTVQWMIVRDAARVGIIGAFIGLGIAFGLRRVVARLVSDAGIDAILACTAAGMLIAVTVAAAWLPATRAARTDPTGALRS